MRILSVTLLFLFSVGFCQKAAAQSQSLSFEELQRQMLELQRRMMQQLQSSPFDNRGFAMPQGRDTTYYFHFDTTFDGGGMSQFFRFSPFGSDSTEGDAGQGFDDFFNRFFGSDNPSGMPDGNSYQLPSDDGNQPKTDDDLLPEERLRQQEGAAKPKKNAPPAKPAEPKPDPKIKTIHI